LIRIEPFTAFTPSAKMVTEVVCGIGSPNHYENVIKPFLSGTAPDKNLIHNSLAYFQRLKEAGHLIKDSGPSVYIYRQKSAEGVEFEGVIIGVSAQDYINGSICKHENTIDAKLEMMVNHIDALRAVGEPILLSDPNEEFMEDWMHLHQEKSPLLFNFTDNKSRQHQLWAVHNQAAIDDLKLNFQKTPRLYIADGHHRIAASARFIEKKGLLQSQNPEDSCIMAFVIPESRLRIKSFHRLLKNTDLEQWMDMIHNASSDFYIDLLKSPAIPEKKGDIVTLTPHGWYRLRLKPGHIHPSPAHNLDVYRLETYVFSKFFNIINSSKDSRLSFTRGDMPPEELLMLRNRGEIDGAFLLYPNTIKEIKEVADAEETMPPKSTWIEPKLPAGMIIKEFSRSI
jgi:uncharacterized protein (DUF1015 family)